MTKQQRKVYDFIANNKGCTTKDIMQQTGIQCPSGRITELREIGVKIESVGRRRYPGSRPFECYAIKDAPTKTKSQFVYDAERGCMVEKRVQVAI